MPLIAGEPALQLTSLGSREPGRTPTCPLRRDSAQRQVAAVALGPG
ncbi:MAG TPA: hypothetical protein VGE76_19110 [Opitutaceae bacterium]